MRRILQETQQGKCLLIVNLQNPLQKKGVFIKKVAQEQMLNAIKKVLYLSVIIAIMLDNLKRQGHELDKKRVKVRNRKFNLTYVRMDSVAYILE